MEIIPPIRQADDFGSGEFGAPRGYGTHRGVDPACYPGSLVLSKMPGKITKFGYPYSDDLSYRYVQVTTEDDLDFRYFYVEPNPDLAIGDIIRTGAVLGVVQDIGKRYPGITGHFHFEVKQGDDYLDPTDFL